MVNCNGTQAHDVIGRTVMHADADGPEYCPLVHAMGPVDSAGHLDPIGQAVHAVWLVLLVYVPAEHATGASVVSGHMYPAGHAVHEVARPRAYSPGQHGMMLAAVVLGHRCPAGQS